MKTLSPYAPLRGAFATTRPRPLLTLLMALGGACAISSSIPAQAAIGLEANILPLAPSPDGPSDAAYLSEALGSFSAPAGFSSSAGSPSTVFAINPALPLPLGLSTVSIDARADTSRALVGVDATTATIRALANSSSANPTTNVTVRGEITDELTFSADPVLGANIDVVLHVGGTTDLTASLGTFVSGATSVYVGSAQFTRTVFGSPFTTIFTPQIDGWTYSSLTNQSLGGFDFHGVVHVSNGIPLGVGLIELVTCGGGASCDFSHTISLALELPQGVRFTSSSGSFLSAVPEGQTYAYMLLGIGVLGIRRRLRLH